MSYGDAFFLRPVVGPASPCPPTTLPSGHLGIDASSIAMGAATGRQGGFLTSTGSSQKRSGARFLHKTREKRWLREAGIATSSLRELLLFRLHRSASLAGLGGPFGPVGCTADS